MQRTLLFFILLLVVVSCKRNDLDQDIVRVKKLQLTERSCPIDSSLFYLKQAQRLIDNYDNFPDTLIIENIFRKGYYYKLKGKPDSASYFFNKTIELVHIPSTRARNYIYFRNAWETDESLNNYTNAISTAQKFIDVSSAPKRNTNNLVYAYNAMERFYLDLGNYNKALFYNELGRKSALETKDVNMFVVTSNSRANIHYKYFDNPDKAFNLLDSLNSIEVSLPIKKQLYRSYGVFYYFEGKYELAIPYYKKVIELSKKVQLYDLNYNLLESYNNITEAYIENKEYALAKKYLDSSKAIIEPNSFKEYVQFYNELLFRYNYRTKNDESILIDEYYSLIENSNKEYERKINEKLTALEFSNEQEQQAIIEKNKAETKTLQFIALSSILGALVLFGYFIFRQRRLNFEKQNLQIQQRLLRSQMNPHFIFNTLSVIQNQIKENKENANTYLLKFSRLLRLILENSLHNYVLIEDELESLRQYLDLQLLRFPNKFKYAINLVNFEEHDLLYIPPMLIQPFIENSIEHGFSGISTKGEISITLKLENNMLLCHIEDNGKGINDHQMRHKTSVSIGLISKFIRKVTNQKLYIINKKEHNPNNRGVLVKFLIPIKTN